MLQSSRRSHQTIVCLTHRDILQRPAEENDNRCWATGRTFPSLCCAGGSWNRLGMPRSFGPACNLWNELYIRLRATEHSQKTSENFFASTLHVDGPSIDRRQRVAIYSFAVKSINRFSAQHTFFDVSKSVWAVHYLCWYLLRMWNQTNRFTLYNTYL